MIIHHLWKHVCQWRSSDFEVLHILTLQSHVASLAKKYGEKYKQVADIASKMTVEEATFRDIQVLLHASCFRVFVFNTLWIFSLEKFS